MTSKRAIKLLSNESPQLNAYQLACGYLQMRTDRRRHLRVTLWHESSHYHVRLTHYESPLDTPISRPVGWIEWDNAIESLAIARKSFARMVRQYHVTRT
jgi:hypothetical protein